MQDLLSAILICLCTYAGGEGTAVRDSVGIIELNEYSYRSAEGKTFHQIIFWEYSTHVAHYNKKTGLTTYRSGYVVVDWRKWHRGDPIPRYNYKLKRYELSIYDRAAKVYRYIVSPTYRRTRTDYDPEVYDQRTHSIYHRRKLSTR